MKSIKLIYLVIIGIVVILGGAFLYKYLISNKTMPPTEQNSPTNDENIYENLYYFPMTDYQNRLTYRKFGENITAEIRPRCGRAFSGIHNGDDLEVLETEINKEVKVFAVNDGEIVFKEYIDGYGGLIILKTSLNNQDVLLNYGHIDITTANVKLGDKITSGQVLAVLGDECSTETDGERKHLHFAIHKGTTIDVKGYLDNQNELGEWLNPTQALTELKAKMPKE